MRNSVLSILFAVLASGVVAAEAPQVHVAKWKGDVKAAFLLAFDDGCPSHLKNAIPLLNRYRIYGTFYLFPAAGHFAWQKDKWAAAAKSLYVVLGNHTIDHKGVNAPEEFEPSVVKCQGEIRAMTPDGKWPRIVSFARPGGVPWKISQEEVLAVLKKHNVTHRPEYHGPPWFCGKTEEALKLIDTTIAKGGMEHIDFHGVGGDWLSAPTDYLEAVCKRLDEKRGEIWSAAHADYHKYVTERDAAKIEDVSVSATGVKFTVRTTLDERLYDLPLTVVVPAKGRKTAKVTVGKAKPVTVEVKDGKVLVDVVSGPVSVAF